MNHATLCGWEGCGTYFQDGLVFGFVAGFSSILPGLACVSFGCLFDGLTYWLEQIFFRSD